MKLEATLYAAKDLPKTKPRARQIPYAVLQIDGMDGDIRTAAVKSSRAPEWNETFELEGISADELDITISVMDKDRVISSVSFSLSDVAAGQEIDQWVELQTEDEKEKGGEIHIRLAFSEETGKDGAPENAAQAVTEEEDGAEKAEDGSAAVEAADTDDGVPMSPKSKRLERKILEDGDQNDQKAQNEKVARIKEIKDKAAEDAREQYMGFLREKTPLLLDNEKRMKQYRAQMEEGSTTNE